MTRTSRKSTTPSVICCTWPALEPETRYCSHAKPRRRNFSTIYSSLNKVWSFRTSHSQPLQFSIRSRPCGRIHPLNMSHRSTALDYCGMDTSEKRVQLSLPIVVSLAPNVRTISPLICEKAQNSGRASYMSQFAGRFTHVRRAVAWAHSGKPLNEQ